MGGPYGRRSYGNTYVASPTMPGGLWSLALRLFIFCYLPFLLPLVSASTFLGESYPIHIIPDRDPTLKYGDSLELFCLLNTSHSMAANRTSVNMDFTSNKNFIGETTIINDTTIRLFVPKPDLGEAFYYCELEVDNGPPLKRLISVAVGKLPELISNFSCYSLGWYNLTCQWLPPKNYLRTTYKGFLYLQGRAGRFPQVCQNGEDGVFHTCTFPSGTYHRAHRLFNFSLTGTNELGSTTQDFTINNFDVVIPTPPSELRQLNKTMNSCLIAFNIPHPFQVFPVGLSVIIHIKSVWDLESWQALNTSHINIKGENYTYLIENLKYAGTPYEVKVYLKSPKSQYISDPATFTFVTLPARPSAPPLTSPGCFDISYNNFSFVIFVYWRMLDDFMKNGEKFDYDVQCVRDKSENCTEYLVEKSMSYAKFVMPEDRAYLFFIRSINEVGLSVNSSQVHVPLFDSVSRPYRPVKMTYGEGEYGLSWSHIGPELPESYTVFYCEDDKERPLPCKGLLSWEFVSGEETTKNVTVKNKEKFHHFGVSAHNRRGESSAISWATCVVSPNSLDLTVTDLAVHDITSQTARVDWQLGCAERSSLAGFILYYCPVPFSENNTTCEGEEQVRRVNFPKMRNTTLVNLKPYTTYDVAISILIGAEVPGRRSSAKRFTTFEDAPDPPTNLRAEEITNSTVLLSWDLPVHKNGVIQNFLLYTTPGSREPYSILVQDKNNIDKKYLITDLNSSTKYTFTLEACTGDGGTKCSKQSDHLTVTTRMHIPGIMRSPHVSILNLTAANVTWEPPALLSFSHYYQVMVRSAQQHIHEILNFTEGSNAVVPIEKFCNADKNEIQFLTRAINVDNELNLTFWGPWSHAESARCDTASYPAYFVYIIIPIILLLAVAGGVLLYFVNREMQKCKDEKEVAVKLPSGLDIPEDVDRDHLEVWPPQHRNEQSSAITCTASDEETLLSKKLTTDGDYEKEQNENGNYSSSNWAQADCPPDSHVMPWEERTRRQSCSLPDLSDITDYAEDSDNEIHAEIPQELGYSLVGSQSPSARGGEGYVTIAENGTMTQNVPKVLPLSTRGSSCGRTRNSSSPLPNLHITAVHSSCPIPGCSTNGRNPRVPHTGYTTGKKNLSEPIVKSQINGNYPSGVPTGCSINGNTSYVTLPVATPNSHTPSTTAYVLNNFGLKSGSLTNGQTVYEESSFINELDEQPDLPTSGFPSKEEMCLTNGTVMENKCLKNGIVGDETHLQDEKDAEVEYSLEDDDLEELQEAIASSTLPRSGYVPHQVFDAST